MQFTGSLSKWVASNVNYIDAFGRRQEPQVLFILDHVEREIKFLQLNEIFRWVEQLAVEFEITVTRKIQPFKANDRPEYFEQSFWRLRCGD